MCQHLTPNNTLSSSCPGSLALTLGRKRPWERSYLNNVISHQSSRHYVVSCITKMALCHYPCPEEIDVFTGPHMRMKQLVYEALEKVSSWSLEERVVVSLCTVVTHERADRSSHSQASLQRWFRFCFEKRLAISGHYSVIYKNSLFNLVNFRNYLSANTTKQFLSDEHLLCIYDEFMTCRPFCLRFAFFSAIDHKLQRRCVAYETFGMYQLHFPRTQTSWGNREHLHYDSSSAPSD